VTSEYRRFTGFVLLRLVALRCSSVDLWCCVAESSKSSSLIFATVLALRSPATCAGVFISACTKENLRCRKQTLTTDCSGSGPARQSPGRNRRHPAKSRRLRDRCRSPDCGHSVYLSPSGYSVQFQCSMPETCLGTESKRHRNPRPLRRLLRDLQNAIAGEGKHSGIPHIGAGET